MSVMIWSCTNLSETLFLLPYTIHTEEHVYINMYSYSRLKMHSKTLDWYEWENNTLIYDVFILWKRDFINT